MYIFHIFFRVYWWSHNYENMSKKFYFLHFSANSEIFSKDFPINWVSELTDLYGTQIISCIFFIIF